MNINFLKSSLFAFGCFCAAVAPAQNSPDPKGAKMSGNKNFYNIKVKIEGYPNDTLILGYRLGKQTYVKDTCIGKNSNGEFVFSKKDTLKGGIYLALLKPSNNYFEFLVPNDKDQQNMSVYTKMTPENDLVKHLKVEGSDDNKVFIDYLHYLGTIRERSDAYNKERETVAKDSNKVKEIDKKQLALNDEVTAYQKNLFTKYPNYLSTKLIKASGAPIVPKEIEAQGQEAAYRYYKSNYFNDVDLADARLIRTPILEEKIEFYLEKLVFQMPDSLNKDIDYIMGLIQKGKDKDVYQYAASHILNKYAKSQVICMDAVYVHVGDKYYCTAKPDWVEKEQLEKICDNVEELRPLRCGAPALEIVARNIADSSQFKLSNLVGKRRYTVLFFFDPACGNCGKAAMRLAPVYDRFKPFGVEVIGVCSKDWKEVEECRKSAKEKGMKWINLSDEAYPLAVIKKSYAIKMNPYIYLYDEDMKLMFKRLDPDQVDEILQREFKMMLEGKLKNRMQLTPQERPGLEKALKEAEKEAAQRKADEEKKKKEEEEKKKTENK